jgi:hypothetical protein
MTVDNEHGKATVDNEHGRVYNQLHTNRTRTRMSVMPLESQFNVPTNGDKITATMNKFLFTTNIQDMWTG